MVDFLINNWFMIIAVVAVIVAAVVIIKKFFDMPRPEQLAKVKEWLLYAVIKAEKELGGGTGQVKLRYVYDMFVIRFPALSKLISFEMFSQMVDEALERMRKLLENNSSVEQYVKE